MIFRRLLFYILGLFPKTLSGTSVLMYHSIGYNSALFSVEPKQFEKQVKYIAEHNIKNFFASDVVYGIQTNTIRPGVCLTFDDGYEDNFLVALPILEAYGIKASFFIATDFIDGYMTTSDGVRIKMASHALLQKVASHPLVELLPHSVTHRKHTTLSDMEITQEIQNSYASVKQMSHKTESIYAYPKGDYDGRVQNIALKAGLKGAFAVVPGIVTRKTNPLSIPRNAISSTTGMAEFRVKITNTIIWYEKIKHSLF